MSITTTPLGKILVVDDERSMREFLTIVLQKEGYDVSTAADGQDALVTLQRDIFDVVITDLKMPNVGGLDVLKAVKETSPATVVIMITAYGSNESAIEATKEGAYDYISKPFQIEEVKLIIKNGLEKRKLVEENALLRREMRDLSGFEHIIGKSDKMQKVFDIVRKVADSKSNILIFGESGTGKELIARAIHFASRRREKPFVTVNCTALPETLLESELFGHMKGSFTGAVANKEGLFEVANEGTIFLDEIGETSLGIQVKLLRVLQEREFRRIGGTKDIKVDVRVIAATNRDLEKAVKEGAFREDLFYRLDVIPIVIPPLRERIEDIPYLAEYFIQRFSKTMGKEIRGITPEGMALLKGHEWRGNVRELENVLERSMALATGKRRGSDIKLLEPEDFKESLQTLAPASHDFSPDMPADGLDLEALVERIERRFLLQALERKNWVKKEAAKLLNLSFRSFRYRLSKYNIRRLPAGQAGVKNDPPHDDTA